MFKSHLGLISLLLLTLLGGLTPSTTYAQSPSTPPSMQTIVTGYLRATGQAGSPAYTTATINQPASAWNAAASAFASPPQPIGPFTNGFGQVTVPGLGTLTPTGAYQQNLVIPVGVPIFGGVSTGLQTTTYTYTSSTGYRVEASPDPLSAFGYALTHPNPGAGFTTGYAMAGSWLGSFLGSDTTNPGQPEAVRLDPALVAAMNANFGQGMGNLFGVGVYVYPPVEEPAAVVEPDTGIAPAPVSPPQPPEPPPPPALPAPTEEVYLKAIIPQPAPEFTVAFQPNYPVVIGQDPTQRGVDVYGHASLGPCTVIWHHVLRMQTIYCGKDKCDCSKDTCEIREVVKEWDSTEYEPDALAAATIDSSLSAKSISYITGPMQQIYPGAKVIQGQVPVYPSAWAHIVENTVGVPSTWAFLAERVPYADPGDWDYHVQLQTTGTPHCAPLNWGKDFPGALSVWLREQRLVK